MNEPDSDSGMVIEGEWRSSLSSLKPLGLGCILNTKCNIDHIMQPKYAVSRCLPLYHC